MSKARTGRGKNWRPELETGLMRIFADMWKELGYDDTSIHSITDRNKKYAVCYCCMDSIIGWMEEVSTDIYVASFPEERKRTLSAIQDKVHSLYREAQVFSIVFVSNTHRKQR